jgi:hypothetical protein
MVWFFAVAGGQWLTSAGSLNFKHWKWFRGVHLESEPANQSTNEELKPYRSCPGRSYDWPEPAELRMKYEERRARAKNENPTSG